MNPRPAYVSVIDPISPAIERVKTVLFQIVIGIAIVAIAIMTMCICCIACCLFMIPFVGTALLLPLIVFKRSYSLYYLAQYGPEFNVFPPEPEVVTPDPQWQS